MNITKKRKIIIASVSLLLAGACVSTFMLGCRGGRAGNLVPVSGRIMIEGRQVEIPSAIGIRDPRFDRGLAVGGSCFEPLHTHDTSGIIHIEGPDPNRQYTLGDFFAVWSATYPTIEIGGTTFPVGFAAGEILGHKADAAHHVRLLVDGKPSSRGPSLVLNGLDYCSAQSTSPPCVPTAAGNPFPPEVLERYGTGHTIVIEFQ